jgi:RNA-dependent RNA polymerase
MHSVLPLQEDLTFVVDLLRNRIVASFNVHFEDPRIRGAQIMLANPKLRSTIESTGTCFRSHLVNWRRSNEWILVLKTLLLSLRLDSPPQYYRKREDETAGHAKGNVNLV